MMKLRYFLLIFISYLSCVLYSQDYQISYLSIQDGLSQNEVTSIVEDQYGFIWFGTRGGLNRYDGYIFKHFKPESGDGSDLSSPSIESLYCDSKGQLWIGTKSGGLSLFDPKFERFIKNTQLNNLPTRITSITEGHDENIWLGTWAEGLWKYDRDKDSLVQTISKTNVKSLISTKGGSVWAETKDGLYNNIKDKIVKDFQSYNVEVVDMIEDDKDPIIWIVGWNMHLVKYNYVTNTIKQYKIKDVKDQLYEDTYSLSFDSQGNILVGTWGQGLYVFDKKEEEFKHIDIEPRFTTKSSINYKVILDIYKDSSSNIWLGTDGGGVVKLSRKSNFTSIGIKTEHKVLRRHVNVFFIDSKGRKWIGTRGSGLYVAKDDVYKKVNFLPTDDLYKAPIIIVKNIFEDDNGEVWISIDQGLFIAKQDTNKNFSLQPVSSFSSEIDTIRKAHDVLFYKNEIWVGTQQQGLFHFLKNGTEYKLNKHYSSLKIGGYIPDNRVTSVFVVDNSLWISTYKGLLKFNQKDSSFVPVEKLLRHKEEPLCNIILSTHENNNDIWFGTPCGLNKLYANDDGSYGLVEMTKKDGLLDDYINAILNDEKGKVWVSTNAGLSCIDYQKNEILNYIVSDGDGVVNFSESASFMGADNKMYFGNYEGLTYFNDRDIVDSQSDPKFVIAGFKILNENVPVSLDGVLTKGINEMDTLEFSYLQKEFSFDIASLDFNTPTKNQFKYQLQGFSANDEWINIGNRHHISFSNLSAGEYVLHFKWTNSNGEWSSDKKSIVIIIHPLIWRTWYALLFYILIAFGVMILIIKIQIKQSRLKDLVKHEKRNREVDQEIIDYKLRFFTDVSHELRTPLTLISAPINELISKDLSKEEPSFIMDKIQIASRNVGKLNNLINQVLDFRKIEVDKIKLNLSDQDIVSFIVEVGKDFQQLACENETEFTIESINVPQIVRFDQERLQIVLHNLLSNAFKYCSSSGVVKLSIDKVMNEIHIKVCNDGKGISKEDSEHLFERFYQASGNQSVKNSGIGLSLARHIL
ncbi:ligand-binding sensor domain-containing protein [Carboxylicivirga sp. N1Y90]|uniref:ligand-binding sensor domain-containing protein n=1 Tax=Carboxylicivirga fragile TaxID=3417571 RepID=UPI003D33D9F1|nr:hypothetical protein [Marinilabiliaceae bacterium N1Y90]